MDDKSHEAQSDYGSKDEVLAEVHRAKEALAREFDYDIDHLFAYLREKQKEHGDRLVDLSRRANRGA